jgi:hypothetical protein
MGLSITVKSTDPTKFLVDAVFAKTYTNGASIPACQVTRNFGGDYCDPSDYEKNVFIYMNTIRTAPTAFDSTFDGIVNAFVPLASTSLDCNYDYNGDGSATLRTFSSKSSGVTSAKATVAGTTAVTALKWSPGLYISAKNHTTDMAAASSVTTAGTDGSTPTSRGAVYGAGTVYETNIIGDNNEMFVIMQSLIGDTDSGEARTKMLKSSYTQTGVA